MRIVYFQKDKELVYFCEKLFHTKKEIDVKWKKDETLGNELLLIGSNVSMRVIVLCLVEVFCYFRLNQIIKKIAHNYYYYTNIDEIDRICQLTNWILTEKNYSTNLYEKHLTWEAYITSLFECGIGENEFIYFDSLVTFNTKSLINCLKLAVGYGIDEMKREEDYQNFIQCTREYIKKKKSKTSVLHIVQGDSFIFYKANGKNYTKMELKALMYAEPLYLLGLDDNEMNVSPVITLLPEKIFIYGDHPSEAKTLTLMSIFHERVQLVPMKLFPFHLNVK